MVYFYHFISLNHTKNLKRDIKLENHKLKPTSQSIKYQPTTSTESHEYKIQVQVSKYKSIAIQNINPINTMLMVDLISCS